MLDVEGLLEAFDLGVVVVPLGHDAHGRVQFGLLGLRIVAQVDRLGLGLGRVVAPRLAPQPLLRQRLDRHLPSPFDFFFSFPSRRFGHIGGGSYLVDHVVGQVLVEVGQTVGVLAEGLVLAAQSVAGGDAPEAFQVDHVQGADVVLATCVHRPISFVVLSCFKKKSFQR